MTYPTLTQPAFIEWERNHVTEDEQIGILEYLKMLESEDTAFLELLKYFNLESYTYSTNDAETICWHNFELLIKSEEAAMDLTPKQLKTLIYQLQDDNQPIPTSTYYMGTLYLTIIGLA